VAAESGRSQLFLRSVDRDEPVAIAGTDEASDPFFSPDGQWIGFFARGSLQKVRIDGGLPMVLAAARAGAGATWTSDNTIVFGGGPGGGLARVSAAAGSRSIGLPDDAPVVIATPEPGTRDLRLGWPDVLPGDRGVLFTSITLPAAMSASSICGAAHARCSLSTRRSRATRRPGTSCSSARDVSRRRDFR
jgi:serine/threonine-protein kinase